MANKIYIDGTIAYRQDSLENWQTKNPVLEAGEPAIVSDATDGNWLKIGDGQTPWQDLPYKMFTDAGNTVKADQTYDPQSENAQSGKAVAEAVKPVDDKIGDIETALDEIIALQEALIGGDIV